MLKQAGLPLLHPVFTAYRHGRAQITHASGGALMTIPASGAAKSAADGFYAKLTVAAVVFFVVLETAYFALSGLPSLSAPSLDFTGNATGRNFITTWMSGRALFGYGPASVFDHAVYNNALRVMLGPNFPEQFWSYPPHFLLFTWPFGFLPYLPAYILWCVFGITVYLLACMAVLGRKHLLFLAAAPGVAVCVFFGENGFYTAALLVGAFALLDRHPILAGFLFGVLTIEPQLVILLPFMLLATRRWRTILSAAVMAGALVTATSHLFGPGVWTDFIDKVIPQQIWLLHNGGGLLNLTMSSVFFSGRLVGLPIDLAWNLQGLVFFLALAAVIWTYWKRRDPALSMALFITATFLASPYLFNYDMVIFGFLVAALRERADNTVVDHALAFLIWSLPVTMMLFGVVKVPIAPLVLAVFAGRLLWRLSRSADERQQATKEDAGREAQPPAAPLPKEELPGTPASSPLPA